MAKKNETRFVCTSCGAPSSSWAGKCPRCGAWGSLEQDLALRTAPGGGKAPGGGPQARAVRASEVPLLDRIPTGVNELDRVLGGGFAPGSVSLLAGEPGIGKSTLLLQACLALARRGRAVLYVSGEESLEQVASRALRLDDQPPPLDLLASGDPEEFMDLLPGRSLVVVDSVQAMGDGESLPGTLSQVRGVAARCIDGAKRSGVPLVLVGHVTKEGQIAGPKLLEHMVDVVLSVEGARHTAYRILRSSKNRFGSTDEIGVFEMGEGGLRPVADASLLFWNGAEGGVPGVAFGVTLEGSRPFVVELQALACPTPFPYPKRTARGVEVNRVQLLLAVLEKRCGLSARTADAYVNVAGGLAVRDPGADLALCAALASSLLDRPLSAGGCLVGEVGLAGEVRPCPRTGARLHEAARLGFTRGVVSSFEEKNFDGELEVVRVGSLNEALAALFPR